MYKGSSISRAAEHLGYNHLGQLSADYKKLFNELPSETLKQLESVDSSSR